MSKILDENIIDGVSQKLAPKDKEFLLGHTPKILPDRPTACGYTAEQIKRYNYEGYEILFNWLSKHVNGLSDFANAVDNFLSTLIANLESGEQGVMSYIFNGQKINIFTIETFAENVNNALEQLKTDLRNGDFLVRETATKAQQDGEGNNIVDTYVKKSQIASSIADNEAKVATLRLVNQLINNIYGDNTDTDLDTIGEIQKAIRSIISNINTLRDNAIQEHEALSQVDTTLNAAINTEAQTRSDSDISLGNRIDAEASTRASSDNSLSERITTEVNRASGVEQALQNSINTINTNFALKSYVDTKIDNLIGASSTALDTLEEIGNALNNDGNFATTMTNALSLKASQSDLEAEISARQSAVSDLLTNRIIPLETALTSVQTSLANKQDTLTFDDTPTANSNNPVKSSGIKSYVDAETTRATGVESNLQSGINQNTSDISTNSTAISGLRDRVSSTETDIDNLETAVANKQPSGNYAHLVDGVIPASELPAYVDDVIEGYVSSDFLTFYSDVEKTNAVIGERGKIYLNLSDLKTYRFTGSLYAIISQTLAIGENSDQAFAGNRGKALETAVSNLQTSMSSKQSAITDSYDASTKTLTFSF